jgi:hypothetical protein
MSGQEQIREMLDGLQHQLVVAHATGHEMTSRDGQIEVDFTFQCRMAVDPEDYQMLAATLPHFSGVMVLSFKPEPVPEVSRCAQCGHVTQAARS